MNMKKEIENGVLTVYLEGKLDTGTAPQAEKDLEEDVNAARQIILDFKELKYLSSSGVFHVAHNACHLRTIVIFSTLSASGNK